MTSNSTKETSAKCTFEFTPELFEEYVCISDFMSKWKKWAGDSLVVIFFLIVFSVLFSCIRVPILFPLLYFTIFGSLLVIHLYALISKRPLLWNSSRKRRWIINLYHKKLGVSSGIAKYEFHFILQNKTIVFETQNAKIETTLEEIRWIRLKENLVIVGCLDDSKSMASNRGFGGSDFYKAIPAVAFLIDKLEGMDAEELIALLEVHAKQHQKDYFWKWQPVSGPM